MSVGGMNVRHRNGRIGDWRRKCATAWRVLCCGVTLAVLLVFAGRMGQGIVRVSQGEITPAQMLQEMGEWLRGKEDKTEGND